MRESRAVRDVTVLVDTVDVSVDVLCDACASAAYPWGSFSSSSGSFSGKLLDNTIGGDADSEGIAPVPLDGGKSIPVNSMRRSTRREALRIETLGSCGRINSETKRRSAGPMGYGGVERL